jgi:hypothetical protein
MPVFFGQAQVNHETIPLFFFTSANVRTAQIIQSNAARERSRLGCRSGQIFFTALVLILVASVLVLPSYARTIAGATRRSQCAVWILRGRVTCAACPCCTSAGRLHHAAAAVETRKRFTINAKTAIRN